MWRQSGFTSSSPHAPTAKSGMPSWLRSPMFATEQPNSSPSDSAAWKLLKPLVILRKLFTSPS
jgi:hypothetical protein